MSYGYWGYQTRQEKDERDFFEKGYKRKGLAKWDARWHALSVEARRAFVENVKGPVQSQRGGGRAVQPSISVEKVPAAVLKELTEAGFVRIEEGRLKTRPDRVFAENAVYDFARRVRTLHRIKLLSSREPGDLQSYLNVAYYNGGLQASISGVLQNAGVESFSLSEQETRRRLTSHRWPGWILNKLKDDLTERVFQVVREAGEPVPIVELPARVKNADAVKVRAALDSLVAYLALVEDLDADNLDVVVGLLPEVREQLAHRAAPQPRPPLVVCDSPRELGPDGCPHIDDMRAVLLEVASEPPRLRQDGAFFSKEVERFLLALPPLPSWLEELMKATPEARLNEAASDATGLKLIRTHSQGKEIRLELSDRGQSWLASSMNDQYSEAYTHCNALPTKDSPSLEDYYDLNNRSYYGNNYQWSYLLSDRGFLGADVSVVKLAAGKTVQGADRPKVADIKALREALGRAFLSLPVGVFHRFDSVIQHFTFGNDNVFLLGLPPDRVRVYALGRPVPPFEEEIEEFTRQALGTFMRARLIAMGCLQTARDDEGRLLVARTPRLGAFFGLEPMPEESGHAKSDSQRVVVQPDFSVVVIGLGTAALAELAPFCDRTTRGAGAVPGAAVLKISRDSVVRAVANGLKPKEILDRLAKHASHTPPANVLREVREWAGWVREVKAETLAVLRCVDRETADRVVAALKGQTERLNDTLVALEASRLTSAERKKLKDQGILIKASTASPPTPAPARKTRRRYY
jgi:hypothetical protein